MALTISAAMLMFQHLKLMYYINEIGPLVRLELKIASKTEWIEAELTQVLFRELGLKQGEHVYIYPRNVRVFLDGQHAGDYIQ